MLCRLALSSSGWAQGRVCLGGPQPTESPPREAALPSPERCVGHIAQTSRLGLGWTI